MQCCMSCKWADFLDIKAGKIVQDHEVQCNFPIPALPFSIPESVKNLEAGYVKPLDGQDCECYETE